MNGEDLKAPFPWFGGKSRVAPEVWAALGPVDNYVDPFAGSLVVLLMRPDDGWQTGAETVNDADCFLSNFWRSLEHDPEAVAHWADWPVNECDLIARHLWLVNTGKERIAKMEADPDFYDAKVAGWWVWGINSWIGSGWCKGNGPWRVVDGVVKLTDGKCGQGVNRQLPRMDCCGHVWSKIKDKPIEQYFLALSARLRRVRVCCGDWSRIVTNGALAFGNTVGIFLDPPYSGDVRTKDLYRTDDHDISKDVLAWALANGNNPRYRICLAGYSNEHDLSAAKGWRQHAWKANRAYGTSGNGDSANNTNRKNEMLWFSPYCLNPEPELFPLGPAGEVEKGGIKSEEISEQKIAVAGGGAP